MGESELLGRFNACNLKSCSCCRTIGYGNVPFVCFSDLFDYTQAKASTLISP